MSVKTKILREVFEREKVDFKITALRMGYVNGKGYPNSYAIKRLLGIVPYNAGSRYGNKLRDHVRVDTVERLIEAAGIDPWEVGL